MLCLLWSIHDCLLKSAVTSILQNSDLYRNYINAQICVVMKPEYNAWIFFQIY